MLDPDTMTPLSFMPADRGDEASLAEEVRQAERRDLARELHDTVIQPLTSLALSFETVRYQPLSEGMLEAYIGAWRELTQEAIEALRSALMGLRMHPHAQLGLIEALHRYLAPQMRSCGVQTAIKCDAWPGDVPLDYTSSLYLVVREALTNIEKHAHASEVTMLLRGDAEQLCVIIADNGVGLPLGGSEPISEPHPGSGFGIGAMRERVEALGGQLVVITSPGRGVQLEIHLPRMRPDNCVPTMESTLSRTEVRRRQ
jgi:signal transduction histidine kinase